MIKTFLKYFGISFQRRISKNNDINLGFSIISDDIVIMGIVFSLFVFNLCFWVHKPNYIVSNTSNTI